MRVKLLCILLGIVAGSPAVPANQGTHPVGDLIPQVADHCVIHVTDDIRQNVYFGVDAERLWYWRATMKEELAQVAVGELKADYVRVAISCGYEREQGHKNDSVYDDILELMASLKAVNPRIKFFASPRPLFEAYKNSEKESIWGHKDNVPWAPYPAWILRWEQKGTKKMGDGSVVPKWKEAGLDLPALVQFFADYLNFMYDKGFSITYLDVTNEKGVISPEACQYIYNNLPAKLNRGVNMPWLIVPSSWSIAQGTEWLNKVDVSKNEHEAFKIAAVHNTGKGGTCEEFVEKATALGREVWNTELHEWTGVEPEDEILNSEVFWQHLRAGFNGIDTWLFFGPAKGKGHTMIWTDPVNKTITRSIKYEVFKQVVNDAGGGNYVDISMPDSVPTAAFIKDRVLSVWVLNKSGRSIPGVRFDLGDKRKFAGDKIEMTCWNKKYPRSGGKSELNIASDGFNCDIERNSLYFFKINLE